MCATRPTSTLAILSFCALVLAGCPSDEQKADDAGTSDAADTVAPEDTGVADTGTDTGQDTGTVDTGTPPPVVQLEYIEETPQCSRNCVQGVAVNLLADPPTITDIDDRSEDEELKPEDVQSLRENLLTEQTADKLENGWDCGDETKYNGQFYRFEGYLREMGSMDQPLRQNIAGCKPSDSQQPDAEAVKNIIERLEGLREDYFSSQ